MKRRIPLPGNMPWLPDFVVPILLVPVHQKKNSRREGRKTLDYLVLFMFNLSIFFSMHPFIYIMWKYYSICL